MYLQPESSGALLDEVVHYPAPRWRLEGEGKGAGAAGAGAHYEGTLRLVGQDLHGNLPGGRGGGGEGIRSLMVAHI